MRSLVGGTIIEPEMMTDGSGRWVIHLDREGKALCGKGIAMMRTNTPQAANCEKCLSMAGSFPDLWVIVLDPGPSYAPPPYRDNSGVPLQPVVRRYFGPYYPIDFCVSFIGENSGLLARSFFGTLGRCCNLDGISLHLINKSLSVRTWSDVVTSAAKLGRPTFTYELDTGWHPYKDGPADSFSYEPSPNIFFNDAARTAEWSVDNCGKAEWCILSHFDVTWRADIIDWLRKEQEIVNATMVGSHCPIMLLNRPAYYKCGVSFDTSVEDVGIKLGQSMNSVCWGDRAHMTSMEQYFNHFGGGGSYHNHEEFRFMRERAVASVKNGGF